MSVALTYQSIVSVQETLEVNIPAANTGNRVVTHSGFTTTQNLTGSSPVPATKCAFFQKALAAGSGSIDFTALPGTNGALVDATGLKVQLFKAVNKGANPITLTEGAVNGLALAGSAFKVILAPGQEWTFYGNDQAPDVAAADKIIDLSGTGTDSLDISVVVG